MQDRQAVIAVAPLLGHDIRLQADLVIEERAGAVAIPDQAVEGREEGGAGRNIAGLQALQVRQPRGVYVGWLFEALDGGRHHFAAGYQLVEESPRLRLPTAAP